MGEKDVEKVGVAQVGSREGRVGSESGRAATNDAATPGSFTTPAMRARMGLHRPMFVEMDRVFSSHKLSWIAGRFDCRAV